MGDVAVDGVAVGNARAAPGGIVDGSACAEGGTRCPLHHLRGLRGGAMCSHGLSPRDLLSCTSALPHTGHLTDGITGSRTFVPHAVCRLRLTTGSVL